MDDNSRFIQLRQRIADLRGRGLYSGWPNANCAIFIHIPKTGGSSVARALFGSSQHVPYFVYERVNPRKFELFFKFAFVRNPWDRLVSTYFFLKSGGVNEMDRRFAAENLAGYDTFGAFVEGWLNEKNIWSWIHFKPQHHFICGANLQVRVDFVGRTETIDADFCYICERLDIAGVLPRVNTSDHARYTEYYTDELRERVAALYAEDIAIFGYQFDRQPVRTLASQSPAGSDDPRDIARKSGASASSLARISYTTDWSGKVIDSAIVVASHPRSGTHLLMDLLRRQFPKCEPPRYQLFLGEPYLNLDEILSKSGVAAEATIARMANVVRPVLKTHRRPDFFAKCQFTSAILRERASFAREVVTRSAKIYVYRSLPNTMISLYATLYPSGEIPFSSFIREIREPWSRVGWWAVHVGEWMRTEGTVVVCYEELMRDPVGVVRQLAEFVGEEPLMCLPLLPRRPSSRQLQRVRKLLRLRRESTALWSYGKPTFDVRLSPEDLEFMREEVMRIDPRLQGLLSVEFELGSN